MYVCTYMPIYMHICIHVYMYNVYMHTCIYVYMYTCIDISHACNEPRPPPKATRVPFSPSARSRPLSHCLSVSLALTLYASVCVCACVCVCVCVRECACVCLVTRKPVGHSLPFRTVTPP